jgi:hypothetical protein
VASDLDRLPAGAVYDRRRRVDTRARLLVRETEEAVRAMGALDAEPSPHLVACLDRMADALARWRAHPRCRRAEEEAFAAAYAVRSAWEHDMAPFPSMLSALRLPGGRDD